MECWVDGYNLERKNHPNLFLFNLDQWFKRKICKTVGRNMLRAKYLTRYDENRKAGFIVISLSQL